ESSYGSGHLQVFRNNVFANAGIDSSYRNDSRLLCQFGLPTDDRLNSVYDLCGGYDRIDPHPGCRAMRLLAINFDGKPVGSSHEPHRLIFDLTQRTDRSNMKTKNHVDIRILQYTLLHHEIGSTLLTGGRSFFRRLENELYGSLYLIAVFRQYLRDAHEDSNVSIVATGVHHPRFLSVARCCFPRDKRK